VTRQELDRLRELAAKATSGPWFDTEGAVWIDTREQVCCGRGTDQCCGEPDVIGGQELVAQCGQTDAAYIAAANPSVITALLDHISRLEREAAEAALIAHWHDFTQCNAYPDGFVERMELFGLAVSKECTQEDFDEEAFTSERGIEVGNLIWVLTEAGHKAYDTATESKP
jgi:hypothetical protein